MLLVKPSAQIIALTSAPMELIEVAGRTCYKSESKITKDSSALFIANLIKNDHTSVLEHAVASVRFIVDRGVSHEIVRHRLASYSQESTRYCDYNKGHVTFVIPPWCNPGHDYMSDVWVKAMEDAEMHYKYLRTQGWKPEQARTVLPNSLKTELFATMNFRSWRHFFKLRTSKKAHPQMREVAIPLLSAFAAIVPTAFADICNEVNNEPNM